MGTTLEVVELGEICWQSEVELGLSEIKRMQQTFTKINGDLDDDRSFEFRRLFQKQASSITERFYDQRRVPLTDAYLNPCTIKYLGVEAKDLTTQMLKWADLPVPKTPDPPSPWSKDIMGLARTAVVGGLVIFGGLMLIGSLGARSRPTNGLDAVRRRRRR